jgi:hypothetical protein
LIKVWDADVEVVERWFQFLRVHCIDGVGMRVEVYRHFPLSIGSTLLDASTSNLRSIPEGLKDGDDATLRASEADSDRVVRLARSIVEDEIAKQDAEETTEKQIQQPSKESTESNEAVEPK